MSDETVVNRGAPAQPLTPRQARFVAQLSASPGRSAADAAREAGYSRTRAATTAAELKRHPAVQAALAEIEAALTSRSKITREAMSDALADGFREARLSGDHGAAVAFASLILKMHGWTSEHVTLDATVGIAAAGARERVRSLVAAAYREQQLLPGELAAEVKP